MSKRISRAGNIDQVTPTVLYTAVGDGTITGLSFNVPAGGVITLSKYEQLTGLTTVLYAITLDAGSGLSDNDSYVLLTGDYLKVLSSTQGSSFNMYVDLP